MYLGQSVSLLPGKSPSTVKAGALASKGLPPGECAMGAFRPQPLLGSALQKPKMPSLLIASFLYFWKRLSQSSFQRGRKPALGKEFSLPFTSSRTVNPGHLAGLWGRGCRIVLFQSRVNFRSLANPSSVSVCVSISIMTDSCNPMDCRPPDSSVHGIFQARILEWLAIPFSRGSSQSRDRTQVSCIAGRFLTIWATKEAQVPPIASTRVHMHWFLVLSSQIHIFPHVEEMICNMELYAFAFSLLGTLSGIPPYLHFLGHFALYLVSLGISPRWKGEKKHSLSLSHLFLPLIVVSFQSNWPGKPV